jgi:hypothetical protein
MVYSKNFGVNYGSLQKYWSKLIFNPKISQKLECTARYSNNFGVSPRALPFFYGVPRSCTPKPFAARQSVEWGTCHSIKIRVHIC